MLRLIFVFGIVACGFVASLQGPFYALLFYLWNAYFRPEYWVWADWLFSLRLSLTIGLILVVASIPSIQEFRWSRQTGLMVLFLAHSALSLVFSNYVSLALPYWTEFVKVIVIALLITLLVNDERRFRLTLFVIAWSLAFEAAKQGWAQLVRNPGATNINPHVMLGDNNGVALGMMMLIPILTALAQTTSNRWERYIHRFVTVGVIYRGISTYSRGGFIAAAVVFLLSLWRSNHKIKTLIVTAAMAFTIYHVMPATFWDRMDTITATEEARDSSAQSRLYFWGIAERMAADNPILGVGFNSFRFAFSRYDSGAEFGGERAVHSVWYGLVSELGFPGLALFAAMLVGALVSCQRVRNMARQHGLTNIVSYASQLQITVVVYAIGGTFLNAQYLELWWHIIALTIALGFVCEREVRVKTEKEAPAAPAVAAEPRVSVRVPQRPAVAQAGRQLASPQRPWPPAAR